MRKILFLMFSLSVTLSAFAIEDDYSYEYFEREGIYYKLSLGWYDRFASVTYKDTSYNSYSGSVEIPETVWYNDREFIVTTIDENAFKNCSALTSVTIPNSITTIGKNAFEGCTSLPVADNVRYADNCAVEMVDKTATSVTIKDGTRLICGGAFSGCSNLTSIKIPNSVTRIEENAFQGCTSLPVENNVCYADNCMLEIVDKTATSITIKDGTRLICDGVFYGCSNLESVTIPNSVKEIGTLFKGCGSLKSVTIPNSVTKIVPYAFGGCSSLTSVTIPDSVTKIGAYVFQGCSNLKSVTIPNSITEIGDYTFSKWTGLTSITIPNSVTSIGWNAFDGCTGLTSVVIGNSVTSFGSFVFRDCSSLTSVNLPNGITKISGYLFSGCSSLKSITIPESVVQIEEYAFEKCSSLASITIPNSVTSIETGVFMDCTGLTSVTIPNNVTQISSSLFIGCSGLTSVTVPNGVTTIETAAFKNCCNLKSINIPDGVTVIEWYAFENCSSLTSIKIPNGITELNIAVFRGCSSLTSVSIPKSVTKMTAWAFVGCTNLKVLSVAAEVPPVCFDEIVDDKMYDTITLEVPNDSYSNAEYWKKFKNISIKLFPSFEYDGIVYSITSKDNKTVSVIYRDSKYSGNVTIPSSVTYDDVTYSVTAIDEGAFKGCENLTSVTIPNSIKSIGFKAFEGCSSLTSVTIPNSVESIVYNAFANCCNLAKVTIESQYILSASYCDTYSMKDIFGLQVKEYIFGNNIMAISEMAFYGSSELTTLIIPNSVEWIYPRAFYVCQNLQSVTIGDGVKFIGYQAFDMCDNLKVIRIAAKIPPTCEYDIVDWRRYDSIILEVPNNRYASANIWKNFKNIQVVSNGLNSAYDFEVDGIYYDVTSDTDKTVSVTDGYSNNSGSITVPSSVTNESITYSVTEISESAFEGKSDLTSLEIPNTVTSIGAYAFYDCKLVEVKVAATNPPTIQENTFSDYSATLYVPKDCVQTYSTAPIWQNFTNIKEWDAGVTGVKVDSNSAVPVDYYDLNGVRYAEPQRGINIVRYSDGSTKKDIVK